MCVRLTTPSAHDNISLLCEQKSHNQQGPLPANICEFFRVAELKQTIPAILPARTRAENVEKIG